jgi:DNA end-binding protein Ku
MAQQLIDSLTADFEPEKYSDEYREKVLELIERKAAGEEIAVQPATDEEEEPVPDLMAALKASLDAVRDKDAEGNGSSKAKKTPAKSKAKSSSSGSRKKAATKS